jgi:hypothetical protein
MSIVGGALGADPSSSSAREDSPLDAHFRRKYAPPSMTIGSAMMNSSP